MSALSACALCGKPLEADSDQRRWCSLACYRAREPGTDFEERFWAKVDRRGPDECWEWQGLRNHNGYGLIWVGRAGAQKRLRAHLVSLRLAARTVPPGRIARHSCDNRACVNPAHLLSGTYADNARDMVERGRHWRQRRG